MTESKPFPDHATLPSDDEITGEGLKALDREIVEIMSCLREMLLSTSRPELADALPWLGDINTVVTALDPAELAQVYSMAFQLLDMVEEQVALATRREREKQLGPEREKGLWPQVIASLVKDGFTGEEIAEAIRSSRVEPVFTAHPTEAKRPSVRERHRDLNAILCRFESPSSSPQERQRSRGDLLAALEALWTTGEIHVERPTIERELRNVLFYLREVFPATIGHLDRHLRWAWENAGLSPDMLAMTDGGPRLRFGLWIGGDRDGHPFVTADVTRETLLELRRQAFKLYLRELAEVASKLSVSSHSHDLPAALRDRIEELTTALGDEGTYIRDRNPVEPWRRFAYLLRAWLRADVKVSRESFHGDLMLLRDSLNEIGASRLAKEFVHPLLRKLDIFGFHLAELDVRQNSAFHDRAAAQLLAAAGIADGASFADWSEEKRLAFLTEELDSPRPFLHFECSAGAEADAVRECYRVLVEHRRKIWRWCGGADRQHDEVAVRSPSCPSLRPGVGIDRVA